MTLIRHSTAMISLVFLALFAWQTTAAATCVGNSHFRPSDFVSDEVNKLFKERNYQKLNELAAKYQKERTAAPDQIAALSAFYRGISQEFNACARTRKTDGEWSAHGAAIAEWVQRYPKSTPAKLAAAMHTAQIGWRSRGTGFISGVSRDGYADFKANIASSREQLERIQSASTNDPAWYAGMLLVALAQGWTPAEASALYEKAVKLDPYYIELHYLNMEFFSARWYGSDEQMHAAIDRSAKLTNERLGQSLFARLQWTRDARAEEFKAGTVDWKRMKAGFEDQIRIYPERRTSNALAQHACMAGDASTAKEQLEKLDNVFSPEFWNSKKHMVYCAAYAKNSGTGKPTQCWANPDNADHIVCE